MADTSKSSRSPKYGKVWRTLPPGRVVPDKEVVRWLDSWGAEVELPAPKCDPTCFDEWDSEADRQGYSSLLTAQVRALGLCLAIGAAMVMPGHAQESAQESAPPSLLVLDLELVDTSGEVTDQTEDHARRLVAIRDTLTTELAAREVYDVVDPAKIQPEILAEIDATQESQYLHACNGCEIRFARDVGADRVLTGHVRKVSSLVMALWVDIKDADTGRPVLRKVLDFRGDNDRAWQQATLYLVRALEELPPDAR